MQPEQQETEGKLERERDGGGGEKSDLQIFISIVFEVRLQVKSGAQNNKEAGKVERAGSWVCSGDSQGDLLHAPPHAKGRIPGVTPP